MFEATKTRQAEVHNSQSIKATEPLPEAMTLEQRLDHVISQNPELCSPESVDRVREFVQYETKHPDWRPPYKLFKTTEDFKLYYQLRPEWHKKSPSEMQKDKESGAQGFYTACRKWALKVTKNKNERIKALRVLIPSKFHHWSTLFTIEDWTNEFNTHPEWNKKSPWEMRNDTESDAGAFYQAYHKWVKKNAESREERIAYMKVIFPNYHATQSRKDTSQISPQEAREELSKLLEVEDE